jgi:alanine racemase
MSRPAKIIIDLAAIKANCCLAQAIAPHAKTAAVIKADAYGHGAVEVAKALEPQVEMFSVSCLEEALVIRQSGIRKPILLLEGCFDASEIKLAVDNQCELIIHNKLQVEQLLSSAITVPVNIWLKIDTGMHRLGFLPHEVAAIYLQLAGSKKVKSIRLTSHFAYADDIDGAHTLQQIKQFNACTAPIIENSICAIELSLANSAAILAWPETRVHWSRPGIMLYGLSPFAQPNEQADKLIPAMHFESQVMALRHIAVGETVGYGCTWQAQRPTTIATVAVGYGDGYPRSAKSGTPVLINGHKAPLAGRVSMDLICVDVTDLPQVNIGDTAILWGKDLSANEVAHWADTIGYELVTRMPKRVERVYIDQ